MMKVNDHFITSWHLVPNTKFRHSFIGSLGLPSVFHPASTRNHKKLCHYCKVSSHAHLHPKIYQESQINFYSPHSVYHVGVETPDV